MTQALQSLLGGLLVLGIIVSIGFATGAFARFLGAETHSRHDLGSNDSDLLTGAGGGEPLFHDAVQ
jgi:hypothetical protein